MEESSGAGEMRSDRRKRLTRKVAKWEELFYFTPKEKNQKGYTQIGQYHFIASR